MLIERNLPGGEEATAYKITNYLGFPDGVFGSELSSRMEKHLEPYNVSYVCEHVEDIVSLPEGVKCVKTDLAKSYTAKGVILALSLIHIRRFRR